MSTTKQPKKDRFVLRKVPQTMRFTQENIDALERMARAYGLTKTAYVELAVREKMERDLAKLP